MINYGKIGIKAAQIKAELSILADQYVEWRESMYLYKKYKNKYPPKDFPAKKAPFVKPPPKRPYMVINAELDSKPITFGRIEEKQVAMNKLRRKCGLRPFSIIPKINKRIIKYKRSKFGKV